MKHHNQDFSLMVKLLIFGTALVIFYYTSQFFAEVITYYHA